MDKIQTAVSLALRDTEICTAAAEVEELLRRHHKYVEDDRRVVAVVTHNRLKALVAGDDIDDTANVEQDGDAGEEEGCLFVMKYVSPSSAELHPYLLFPIDSKFSASLKQRDGPAGSAFEVNFKIPNTSVLIASSNMPALSSVLEEARRLRRLKDPTSNLLSPNLPPSPDPEGKAVSEPDKTMEDLPGSKSGLKTEDPSGSEIRNDSEALPNSSEDESKNLVEVKEEKQWEWLYFYSSHRSSRILPSQRPKPRDIRHVKKGYALSSSSAGLYEDEDYDIALIRDHWVDRQLSLRRDEYSQRQNLKLRIGTFNVNGKPPTQSLMPWIWASGSHSESVDNRPPHDLPEQDGLSELADTDFPLEKTSLDDEPKPSTTDIPDSSSLDTSTATSFGVQNSKYTLTHSSPPSSIFSDNNEDFPDIIVLGFQELDLSAEALLYSTSTLKADSWISSIFTALGKSADNYVKLASKQLVGVLVVVIIRKELQSMIKEVSTGSAGVGLMGIMGNKGATAVRLRINSTTVTFVCSHLAAFDDYVDRRNSDFFEIARKLEFPITWKGARGTRTITANIWETDMLFWLGDLNYRIDLPDDEIRTLLLNEPEGNENSTLVVYDQLRTTIRHRRAFAGFTEHHIEFPPTYRFTEELVDQSGYDKKRKPAWTDRILHISTDLTMVSQKSYQSYPMVTLSDHRPVSADFDITVYEYDPHKSHGVANTLFKKLGDFENSAERPTVSILDGAEVDVGSVSYMNPVSRSIRVRNDGRVPCAFRFLPLEPGLPICKEWLQLEPIDGLLLPGESESIKITVNIDKRSASFLNHGNTRLEDNLILHLLKGTDHIISVFGSYQPTCFANSLAWLVRSSGPIRTHSNVALLPEANTLSAPRELMFLIEWLITNAQDVPDLFMASAEESLVRTIQEHLDTQRLDGMATATAISFPEDTEHKSMALAYGEALLQFLDSLTEPVIPWVLHPRCALAINREDAFEILDDVPSFARNVYVTVTAFLHFIAQSGGPKRSGALARVFADVLLRDNPRPPTGMPALTPLGKRNFLLHTIA